MRLPGDELAGVVDLFGGLPRSELEAAVSELAFRRGEEFDAGAHRDAVVDALDAYRLVAVDADGLAVSPPVEEDLVVAGPTAFPRLPEEAVDLPHILDVPERSPDRTTVGRAAAGRLRREAAGVADDGDAERAAALLDVTYDLEAWAPVDLADVRAGLDAVRA